MKNNYSRGKKLIFSFFYELFWWLNFKSKLVPGIMSDYVRFFLMFLLVKLTFLGEQNFNLGLYSIRFWSQRSNSIIKRWFFEILYRNKSPNKVKTYIFQLDEIFRLVYKFWCFEEKNYFLYFYLWIMTKIFEICISLQNIKIYTPIERSRQAELKNIYFDLICTFIPI